MLVTVAMAMVVSMWLGVPYEANTFSRLMLLFSSMIPALLVLLMLGRFVYLALVLRPERPIEQMLSDVRRVFFDFERMSTGSVMLAWHYAIDGYLGALIGLFGWKAAGWMVRKDGTA